MFNYYPPNVNLVVLGIEEDPNKLICQNCDQYEENCDC